MQLTQKIKTLLDDNHIPYREVTHAASPTCEISASERGESIEIGGKAVLFKAKKSFYLFVLSAAKQVDSNKVRKILGSQKLRFATEDELEQQAGVVKGALPPFGKPLQPFDLFLDESILKNESIAFNAGDLTVSIILKVEDYLKVVNPKVFSFAKDS